MVKKNEEKGITKSEMVELLSVNKIDMVKLLSVTKNEMIELLNISKTETTELLSASKNEMVELLSEQFALVFRQIDFSADTIRVEFKSEIGQFRKDMNHRFESVEKRLSSIENNMVFSYEHSALNKRVEKLESMNA